MHTTRSSQEVTSCSARLVWFTTLVSKEISGSLKVQCVGGRGDSVLSFGLHSVLAYWFVVSLIFQHSQEFRSVHYFISANINFKSYCPDPEMNINKTKRKKITLKCKQLSDISKGLQDCQNHHASSYKSTQASTDLSVCQCAGSCLTWKQQTGFHKNDVKQRNITITSGLNKSMRNERAGQCYALRYA